MIKSLLFGGAFLLLQVSCTSEEKEQDNTSLKETEPIITVRSGEYVKLAGEAQGTTYHITYQSASGVHWKTSVDSLLEDFDNSLSTYNPGSSISEFNGYGEAIVDDNFKNVFLLSKRVYIETKGAFNPALYPIIDLWGFGVSNADIVTQEEVDSLLQFTDFNEVYLEPESNRLIAGNGNQIEFNAIAQGYSVDIVCDFLKSKGIENYLVEIGGELRVKGFNAKGEPWKLAIERPEENRTTDYQMVITLTDGALATSGNYRNYQEVNGNRVTHTIDPGTGRPTEHNLLSASVICKTAGEADAYATALMVMGVAKGIQFIKDNPELELEVVLVYDENGEYKVYESAGIDEIASE